MNPRASFDENVVRERMVRLAQSLHARGLSPGSSGNISVRLADGYLMTPTNACLGDLDPSRLARLDRNFLPIAGDPPSKEVYLHRAYYSAREQAGAVVHLHSTHAVAVSCLADIDPNDCLPPITPYFVMKIGQLPRLPYFRPGDPAMGDAVHALAARHVALLLANHGPVVSGATLDDAVNNAEELEETAKLFLLLRQHSIRVLAPDQIAALKRP